MAREFQRGEKARISDLTAGRDLYVGVRIAGPGLTLDISCFGLDGDERLSDDRYFVFYNQPASPEQAIQQLGAQSGDTESFRVTLDSVPSHIRKLSFTATVDGAGQVSQVDPGYIRIVAGGEEVARYGFTGAEFSTERAVMLGDVYYRNDWRFAAVGQGFDGGLEALLKNFGGEVVEEEQAPEAAAAQNVASPTQAAGPPGFAPPPAPAPTVQPPASGPPQDGHPAGSTPPQQVIPPPAAQQAPTPPGMVPPPRPPQPPIHEAPTLAAPIMPPGAVPPAVPPAPTPAPFSPPGQSNGHVAPGAPSMATPGGPGHGSPDTAAGNGGLSAAATAGPRSGVADGVQGGLSPYLETEAGQRWTLQNRQLVRADLGIDGQPVLARQGSMVLYQGKVEFAYKGAGFVGRIVGHATGQEMQLMRCTGQGQVFLADEASQLHPIDLQGDAICVSAENVLAFDESLHHEVRRIDGHGIPGGALFTMQFQGTGTVVVKTHGTPVVLPVTPTTFADSNAIVAWSAGSQVIISSQVRLRRTAFPGHSGETVNLHFRGTPGNFIVVQPYEV